MADQSTITFRHNAERHRYEILDGLGVIGRTLYVPFEAADGPQRIFFHTKVDEDYAGQGLASKLARFALDGTREAGAKIVAVCPYINAYTAKHHEYDDILVKTTPQHLAAVPPVPGR